MLPAASHVCPWCICRYEQGLMIAVTAALGGALLAKGFDSLVRPGGTEHLDVTKLTGHQLMKDVSSQTHAHAPATSSMDLSAQLGLFNPPCMFSRRMSSFHAH